MSSSGNKFLALSVSAIAVKHTYLNWMNKTLVLESMQWHLGQSGVHLTGCGKTPQAPVWEVLNCMMELLIPEETSPISFKSSCFATFFPTNGSKHTKNMYINFTAAAAAKLFRWCPTLCDSIDSSPSGSPSLGFSR